ncbi:MAG: outer membrane lipoprotein chaperone LolA [Silvibacterium sp.]
MRTRPWRLALTVLMALGPVLAVAQQPLTANELTNRIDQHYNSLHSLEVRFTQQYDGMGMNRKEVGVLLLKKPGKMRWTYSQPAGKLFILDGHDGYFYSPGDTEVQRVPVKKLDDMRSPLRLLLGHAKLEQELTGLSIAPQADGTYVLTGIPKNMEKRVAAFSVTATPQGVIQSIRVEETDGIINSFLFKDERPNVAAPDASFVFTAPAGVNVVEGKPPV